MKSDVDIIELVIMKTFFSVWWVGNEEGIESVQLCRKWSIIR
jgi:hypothetical protein